MVRYGVFLSTVFVAAVMAAGAYGADMPGTRPLPVPAETRVPLVDLAKYGWYLRGDLGYRWGTLSGANSAAGFPDPSQNRLGTAMSGTLGIGIKSDWLRTDFTADLASAQTYRGTVVAPDNTTAKIQSTSLLFNGYLDLGSWYGFTPYIGAGAGGSYVRVFDYSSTAAPPFAPASNANAQWKFTWAAMAGVGLQVAPNIMLDLGYRYLNFGDVKTASDSFGPMTFKNVAAHEVRIGMRWSFDDIRRYR